MSDIIDVMRKQANSLLKAEVEGYDKWKGLKHEKDGLELLLNHTISRIEFITKKGDVKEIVASSNTSLIKMFSLKKPDKKTLVELSHMKSNGIHIRDKNKVSTWDFLGNKWCDIDLRMWRVVNCVTISEENIMVLNKVMKGLLGHDE